MAESPVLPKPIEFQATFETGPLTRINPFDIGFKGLTLTILGLTYPIYKKYDWRWAVVPASLSVGMTISYQLIRYPVRGLLNSAANLPNWYPIRAGKAFRRPPTDERRKEKIEELQKAGYEVQTLSLTTPDRATLDGIAILADSADRWLVRLNGNGECWEKLDTRCIGQSGTNWIWFNYRGVGLRSKGQAMTQDEYVIDVATVLQYLVNHEKVDTAQIGLFCKSLGGGIGAETLSRLPEALQPAGPHVFVQTFSTLHDAVRVFVATMKRDNFRLGTLAAWGVRLLGWKMEPAALWSELPGQKLVVWHRSDAVMRSGLCDLGNAIADDQDGDLQPPDETTQFFQLTGAGSLDEHISPIASYGNGAQIWKDIRERLNTAIIED